MENQPEPLLAADDDLGVLGDPPRHVQHEAGVWLHVRATNPPATHAKGGRLLQKCGRADLVLRDVQRHFDRSHNSSLLRVCSGVTAGAAYTLLLDWDPCL